MKRAATITLAFAITLGGCTYKVMPTSTKPMNIYSHHDEKVHGRFGLLIDHSVREVHRSIKPSSHACSGHSYPLEMGDSLATSVRHTSEMLFDEVVEMHTAPTGEAMRADNIRGYALVKLDEFKPRVNCAAGFWSMTCTAHADVAFGITVRGLDGILFSTAVGGTKSADGDAGGACEAVAGLVANAIELATRDALERMAERISNSPKLRANATPTEEKK
jgi:hypothetical protein